MRETRLYARAELGLIVAVTVAKCLRAVFKDQAFNRIDDQVGLLQRHSMTAVLRNDKAMVFETGCEILLQRKPLIFQLIAKRPAR